MFFKRLLPLTLAVLLSAFAIGAGSARAYPQYSQNKDATYCAACHGDFQASPYVALSDGSDWGKSLMDMHKDDILSNDCDVCHGSGPRFPVYTDSSAGGVGLDPISCTGCHGRLEDSMGGTLGAGAGLRQHHWVANRTINGISTQICLDCHDDADPGNYTPVTEDVMPPYYVSPAGSDTNYPNMPSDPCNPAADGYPESYAGSTEGLDNDGNGLYDEADTIPCPEPGQLAMLLPGIGMLLMLERRWRR